MKRISKLLWVAAFCHLVCLFHSTQSEASNWNFKKSAAPKRQENNRHAYRCESTVRSHDGSPSSEFLAYETKYPELTWNFKWLRINNISITRPFVREVLQGSSSICSLEHLLGFESCDFPYLQWTIPMMFDESAAEPIGWYGVLDSSRALEGDRAMLRLGFRRSDDLEDKLNYQELVCWPFEK